MNRIKHMRNPGDGGWFIFFLSTVAFNFGFVALIFSLFLERWGDSDAHATLLVGGVMVAVSSMIVMTLRHSHN